MGRGLICYYSSTGNTKLACECIRDSVDSIPFELVNLVTDKLPDLNEYDVIGFATFTDWWGIPRIFELFLEELPVTEGKPCFVLNTFAHRSGQTLKVLGNKAVDRGFKIIGYHSLRTTGSYSPSIAKGRTFDDAPTQKELIQFRRFIYNLDKTITNVLAGMEIQNKKIHIGLFNIFLREYPRTKSRDEMGIKYIDSELCTMCGLCEKGCPYKAIKLGPLPKFDQTKCFGCWGCYNKCPNKAIFTNYLRAEGHYPRPTHELKAKLVKS